MIIVLRIGHRKERDKRISTHIGLVSRAFKADKIIYSGEEDNTLPRSINEVVKNWGGSFKAEYSKDYKRIIIEYAKKNFKIIHLTMYGLPLEKEIVKIREHENLLLIVGGEKVPPDVYEASDYNISVTNQPHSEVAALALALDRIFKGKELETNYPSAGKRIKPSVKGKKFY